MKTFQKPLTSGEEAEYIRLLQEGAPEEARRAKEILIERNLRLVAHIAKKYQNVDEDMARCGVKEFLEIISLALDEYADD